jgi:hypothetical protein
MVAYPQSQALPIDPFRVRGVNFAKKLIQIRATRTSGIYPIAYLAAAMAHFSAFCGAHDFAIA